LPQTVLRISKIFLIFFKSYSIEANIFVFYFICFFFDLTMFEISIYKCYIVKCNKMNVNKSFFIVISISTNCIFHENMISFTFLSVSTIILNSTILKSVFVSGSFGDSWLSEMFFFLPIESHFCWLHSPR